MAWHGLGAQTVGKDRPEMRLEYGDTTRLPDLGDRVRWSRFSPSIESSSCQ